MAGLCVYYSLTGRTRALVEDLHRNDPELLVVRLETIEDLRPPISTVKLLWLNVLALFVGRRIPIKQVVIPDMVYDYLLIAAPTWGSKPAGPILSFLDRDLGRIRFRQARYMISCRGFWRGNSRYLERKIGRRMTGCVVPYGGSLPGSIVEVWRDICRRPPRDRASTLPR